MLFLLLDCTAYRFCNRLETLIGLIEIRCPALRLTRVKKGITRRFCVNPQRNIFKGGNSSSTPANPRRPQSSFSLFRTLTFTSLPTVQHHSATVLTSHGTKTIQDSAEHRGRSEALPLIALTNPARPRRFRDFISLHAEAVLYAVNPRPYHFLFH